MFTSILTSIEYEAYSRGLDYFSYMKFHAETIPDTPLVGQDLYNALCAAFGDCEL